MLVLIQGRRELSKIGGGGGVLGSWPTSSWRNFDQLSEGGGGVKANT